MSADEVFNPLQQNAVVMIAEDGIADPVQYVVVPPTSRSAFIPKTVDSGDGSSYTYQKMLEPEKDALTGHVILIRAAFRCANRKLDQRGGECLARLSGAYNLATNEFGSLQYGRQPHTCIRSREITPGAPTNIQEEMHNRVVSLASLSKYVPAREIRNTVFTEFDLKYAGRPTFGTLGTEQILSLVHHTRASVFGDWEQHIRTDQLLHMSTEDVKHFFQFSLTQSLPDPANLNNFKLHNFVGWAHPFLKPLCKQRGLHLFVDGTFNVAPRGFQQLLVFMIFDSVTELYIPIYYVIMDCKREDCYRLAFTQVVHAAQYQLQPTVVSCDFETALLKTVHWIWPNAHIIGCLFHFKQALYKQLSLGKLSVDTIGLLCNDECGLLNILTSVPTEEITTKGLC